MTDHVDKLKRRLAEIQPLEGDALAVALREFEQEISNAHSKLSAYHQRQFEDLLKPLRERVKKGKIKPFAFKRKDIVAADASSTTSVDGLKKKEDILKTHTVERPSAATVTVKQASIETNVRDEALTGKDLEFRDLTDQVICITIPTGAVTLLNLQRCKVYIAGIVRSSLVVRDVEQCEVHCRSKQVRIHNAKNCTFYVQCLTPPIIEKSTELRFGPYSLRLRDSSITTCSEDVVFDLESEINYSKVKDFNWLKPKQSPNWSVVERKKSTGDEEETLLAFGIEV